MEWQTALKAAKVLSQCEFESHSLRVFITVTSPEDPAYALLLDEFTTTPDSSIYRDDCYICVDPEFAQMGLPLCYPCKECGGHVPADDTECDDCGLDQRPQDDVSCTRNDYSELIDSEVTIDS